MSSQHTHQIWAQSDTVCLPKLFLYQNCSVLKLQQSELTKPLSNLMLLWPKPQTSYPDRSTQSKERAHQVWSRSKHVWSSEHRLEDRPVRCTKSWQKSPLLLLPLFSLGCGILVCSLILWHDSQLLAHTLTQPPRMVRFCSHLSRMQLGRWIRTSINDWHVLDFSGRYWAANTPPCGKHGPSCRSPQHFFNRWYTCYAYSKKILNSIWWPPSTY